MSHPLYTTVGSQRFAGGEAAETPSVVAEETPVALVYNGVSHAVMMATPSDIEDFALGFSLTEGILENRGELLDFESSPVEGGIEARMTISARRFAALSERHRNLEGRTGCGLCGVDSLKQAIQPVRPVHSSFRISPAAIYKALAALPEQQLINRLTRSIHAAAFVDAEGAIQLVREDVGRHNALDKLIGALALRRIDPSQGFALLTSRCSFELVQKSMRVGIPMVAAISAPTALAVRLAEESGITVIAVARPDSFVVFTHAERVHAEKGATRVCA